MPRRYESGILTEEELLSKIFEYKIYYQKN